MQIQGISLRRMDFTGKDKIYLKADNLFLKKAISEVHKHSLRRLLLAFLRETIFPYSYQNNTLIFDFSRSNCFLNVNKVKLFSLLRFTGFDSLVLMDKKTCSEQFITDPLKLLDIVKVELGNTSNGEQWDKVYHEIANHVQNAVLSYREKFKLKNRLSLARSHGRDYDCLPDFFHDSKNHSLRFEQVAFNGHPYHPCAKTKLGFSIEDVLNYSPEFCPKVSVFLAAVHKDYLYISKSEEKPDFADWFAENYPDIWKKWLVKFQNLDLNANDYFPFPVHPWQATHIIPDLFPDYLKEKTILLFKSVTVSMGPTLSFRTLAPLGNSQAPHMKLSVAIQATSGMRTITNASTENAPKITSILETILKKENHFSGRLFILPEYYGLHLKYIHEEKSKNFAAIFRENINNYLKHDEVSIVVSTLFEKISPKNRSFFIELLQVAECLNYEDALDYFYKYADIILGGYLDLYLIYGIALDGHQQNTLALFQNAHIKRVIAKDFAGIRIHGATLEARGFQYRAYSNSLTLTEDKDAVRNQLLYTVYQIHLGELILVLAEYFLCEEAPFWEIVRAITDQRFRQLQARLEKIVWQTEYDAILKNDWSLKALLRMRLEKPHRRGNLFSPVSNPLVVYAART